jgi:diguanylate cyclase (GGDEF)-like protein/PAS domain S-box-containing protein
MDEFSSTTAEAAGPTDSRPLRNANTLRELVFNINEGIYISTPDGSVLDANPALIKLLGASSLEELQAHKTRDLSANALQWESEHAQLERDGIVRDFELEIHALDGTEKTVLDTCYMVRDPESSEPLLYGILIDITQRKKLEEHLKTLLIRDPLTGCYNRRFLDDLQAKVDQAGTAVGAIVIDVDKFKEYNDLHGHSAGDEVLVRLAKFLMREVRMEDAVVRTGGDEFVVVLQGDCVESTRDVARRYAERARQAAPVPISLGWAVRMPDESLHETVNRAGEELIHIRLVERRPSRRGMRRSETGT